MAGEPMARPRSLAVRERNAKAVELRRRGLTYAAIAAELELASPGKAHDAVRLGVRDSVREDTSEQAYVELDRLDEMLRILYRVAATKHYVSSSRGDVVCHPDTGAPLVDDAPVIAAVNGMRQVSESRRKLLGLDKPTRHEVRNVDAIDAELIDLAEQVGELGAGDTTGLPIEA
jgi:hypothetical protein